MVTGCVYIYIYIPSARGRWSHVLDYTIVKQQQPPTAGYKDRVCPVDNSLITSLYASHYAVTTVACCVLC